MTRKYTSSDYVVQLPLDVQKGIRKSLANSLSKEGDYVEYPIGSGRTRCYSDLTQKQKSEVLDDMMGWRLSYYPNYTYWLKKANRQI